MIGIATDYCVKATALDAVKHGFNTRVLLPLTAAVTAVGRHAAIVEMEAAGVELFHGGRCPHQYVAPESLHWQQHRIH